MNRETFGKIQGGLAVGALGYAVMSGCLVVESQQEAARDAAVVQTYITANDAKQAAHEQQVTDDANNNAELAGILSATLVGSSIVFASFAYSNLKRPKKSL